MPYIVPTLRDLMQKARFGFRRHMKGTDAAIWPNNIYPVAKVIAGHTSEIMGYASYIALGRFAHTAPDVESLALHGEEFSIPRKPALPAVGKIIVTSSDALTVETGAIFRRLDAVDYVVTAGASIASAGSVTVPASAVSDGILPNGAAGSGLSIISGVTSEGEVTAGVDGSGFSLGADVEDIESWRARILFRKRNPPHGGSAADYVLWAGEVSGVSFFIDRPTVFVERLYAGPGTVRVFPLMYDLYESGIPSPADVARVADYIEQVRPAGAVVTVAAAIPKVVNIVISGLSPDTVDTREAVLAELRDMFQRRSRVAGADREISGMPYLAYPVGFSRSWIWQAIANATGEDRHVLVSPGGDVSLSPGEKPVLGTVSFV